LRPALGIDRADHDFIIALIIEESRNAVEDRNDEAANEGGRSR
jgi:hypothetical protein